MPQLGFPAALVIAVALGATAVAGVVWLTDDGLPVAELLRLESSQDGPSPLLNEQTEWAFQILGGTRSFTEADLRERLAPAFAAGFTVQQLNDATAALHASFGTIGFVRFADSAPDGARAIGVGENGSPLLATINVSEDGRIAGLTVAVTPSPPRLPGWQSAILLLAGGLFIVAAATAHRIGVTGPAWVLLLTGLLAFAPVLTLTDSSLVYSLGRVAPPLVLVPAVWLLAPAIAGRPYRSALLAAATLAAGVGAVAPLTRDAALIGHPDLLVRLADSGDAYRALLASAALLTGLALTLAVLVLVRHLRVETRWRRPPHGAALAVAGAWGIGAFGAALVYAAGDGGWGGDALLAVGLTALAAVPVVTGFRLVSAQWHQPELAGLVIDLDSGGGALQPAVARALEDPTVEVLTSPDGARLYNEAGTALRSDRVPAGRALTQIRSGGRLVGGLIHDPGLRHQPERLQGVVAAAGLALEVDRLSEEVRTQLREAHASRMRIIEASDAARRRVERDLHDGAQQRLVALGLDLQRAKRLAHSAGEDQLAAELESATAGIRGTLEDIRAVSRGSLPALLAERGVRAAVEALAERSPVPVRMDVLGDRLPAPVEVTAYYLVAEALTNVAKHARATSAAVSIARRDGAVCIEVRDDGRGGAAISPGSGLEGLNDRVAAVGGTFSVRSGATGTTLQAVIPCE